MDWKQLLKRLAKGVYRTLRDPEKVRKTMTLIIVVPITIYVIYEVVRCLLATFGIIPW